MLNFFALRPPRKTAVFSHRSTRQYAICLSSGEMEKNFHTRLRCFLGSIGAEGTDGVGPGAWAAIGNIPNANKKPK